MFPISQCKLGPLVEVMTHIENNKVEIITTVKPVFGLKPTSCLLYTVWPGILLITWRHRRPSHFSFAFLQLVYLLNWNAY